MAKTQTTEDVTTNEDVRKNSKRQLAATVTTATLSVALGIAANVLIGKVTEKVADKMTKKNPETDETN